MYFSSIFPFLAVFFATCFPLVSSDELNLGFQASINIDQIQIYNEYDEQQGAGNSTSTGNATVAPGANLIRLSSSYSTFIVPVTITRIASDIQSLTLKLFTRLYDYDEDEGQQDTQVYQQQVYLDGQNIYDAITAFNISTESIDTVVYYFRAELEIDEGIIGGLPTQTLSGAAVLSYNSTFETWTKSAPSDFAHQENEVLHAEFETELALSSQPPIDTTSETIITDQDPDLPEDPSDETIVNPPKEDSNTTTPSAPVDKHTPTPKPDDRCKHPYSWKRNNDGQWKENSESTPCPTSTPPPSPPPPCPSGPEYAPIHARQTTGPVTRLQLTLTYGSLSGPKPEPAPVRQLTVTAFGIINNKKVTAIGKTNNNGFVSFAFPSNGNLLVNKLSVSLDAEKYRVSTSKDGGKTFLF